MLHFIHPFTSIIAGPSGCGKTYFITNFLKNMHNLCDVYFEDIIWCYDEMQSLHKSFKHVTFHQGMPDLSLFSGEKPTLIIFDDLMRETDGRIVDIFTKGSHHRNLSVFYITQNMFHQGRGQRDISLNASYIICFKNPRDKTQIQYMARQVYPENVKFVRDAYNDATALPYGYLMIDLKQNTPDWCRFKTNIFPPDEYCTVYIPKKGLKYNSRNMPSIIYK